MKKIQVPNPGKKIRFAESEVFRVTFETDLDFQKSGCRLKGRW